MKASDVMTTGVITVGLDASVQDTAATLLRNRISAVPVVDANNAPQWSGIANGQVDNDATTDIWTISTANRVAVGAATCDSANANNPGGEPLVESNDVNR